ncbi:MAG: tetratricopeptide repeat protein [Gammaproteobacteria bacterium]|nr:tetratricopeptide repeat protein [Gammaproteobacteria bacterium]
MSLFQELKRRNVFRVGAAYVVTAWLIVQVADVALEAFGTPAWVMKTLLLLVFIGFPVALLFAWAFEKTPEGLKLEKNVDRSQSITSVTGKKMDRGIIIALGIAVVFLLVDKFVWRESPDISGQASTEQSATDSQAAAKTSNEHSIAVLPFVDMSEAGDSAYFADGLSEELLNLLAKIKELQVVGRTSSFAFKGNNQDLRLIGEQLNVEHVLEGSVRRAGNKVRVTAQLVSARDGYHVWSETYDRELTDIFAIQDDIASHVVEALKIELLGAQPVPVSQFETASADAYNFYLLGKGKLREMSFSSLRTALENFKQAVALDPAYAPAYAGLAETAFRLYETGAISQQEFLELAPDALESALHLDPGNAEAMAILGSVRVAENRYEDAARAYKQSLVLSPNNVTALAAYGDALLDAGDVEQALEVFQRAARLNPLSVNDQWNVADALEKMGRCDEALEIWARIRVLDESDASGWYGPARCMIWQGRLDMAVTMQREASRLDPDDFENKGGTALFYRQLEAMDEAQEWAAKSLAQGPGQPVPLGVSAVLAAGAGDFNKAQKIAGDALAERLTQRHGSADYFLDIGLGQARTGEDYNQLLDYERFYSPLLFENPPRFTAWWQVSAAARIAYIYRQLERTREYERLIRATDEYLARLPAGMKRGYLLQPVASLHVLEGRPEAAIQAIQDGGFIWNWFLLADDPLLAPIVDDPRFKAVIADIQGRMAVQRESLRERDKAEKSALAQ